MIMWVWCVWFRPVPLLRLWVSCMTPCWRSLTPPASLFLASSISSDLLTPYISTSSLCLHFVGNRSSQPCTSPSPDIPFVYFLLPNLFHFQFRLLNPLHLLSLLVILQSNGSHVFFVLISSMYYRKMFACLLFFAFCFPSDVWLSSL